MTDYSQTAVILIGRNEGARLIRGLASVPAGVFGLIYVDSGSTDGSIAAAQSAGATVVSLDMSRPFTAARARNAGLGKLAQLSVTPEFVQFMDADCELQPNWIEVAQKHLNQFSDVAVVCGRRRERFPTASVYNQLIDLEWDTPIGQAKSCGGDFLIRLQVLQKMGGFNPKLIAGEEPELCVRIRKAGWHIWRLDAEMTLHDAALNSFPQWWKRIRRGGHAFAEGASLHGAAPECHFIKETRRALVWGAALPVLILFMALFIGPWALFGLLIWPVQILRLRIRGETWITALFLTLAKFPESLGALEFYWNRLMGRRTGLIEYK